MAHVATDLAVTFPEDRPGMLAKALNALSTAGINLEGHAEMEGVVHVPGSAAGIFRRIADAKVNIRFSYLATGNRLVIGADNLDELSAALSD